MRILSLALLCLFFVAAGAGAQEPTTAYYEGKTTRALPDGSAAGSMSCLVRRTLYPDQKLIVESNICDHAPGKVMEFVTVASVTGENFAFVELNGGFRGDGRLHGAPWSWDSWQSRSNMPDGSALESKDKLTDTGLVAEKTYFDASGVLVIRMKEVLSSIAAAKYKDRRRALVGDR